jgi:phosphoglycerate dehydrogenase-like enzyme
MIHNKLTKVHYLYPPPKEALALLEDYLDPKVKLTSGADLPKEADYQILIAGRPTPKSLQASSELQVLVIPYAGVPESTRQMLAQYPHVRVHNLHHNAVPTAEMAIALLLAAAKFLVPIDRNMRVHDWRPRYQPNPAILLEGKTALILGYGAIGQHVGRVLRAMGALVLGIRRNPKPDDNGDIYQVTALPELLPQTDILLVTLPLTPETEGMIGEIELSLLPAGAILVNVGRGAVVDQKALYDALKTRHLHAAGLDVWYNYPPDEAARGCTPPADYPFHELDNLVMSPHRGGGSMETERLRMDHLALTLNAAARGEPIPNPVDLEAGY